MKVGVASGRVLRSTILLLAATVALHAVAAAEERDETIIKQMSEKSSDGKRELEIGKFYPSLEGGVTLTQSAYSDNWVGGDKGSIVWTAFVNGHLENQLSEKVNWWNQLKLAYGQTSNQQDSDGHPGTRYWERPEKSTDQIDFETIFRFTFDGPLDPFVAGHFESQYRDDSDALGRTLSLNPLKFKEGVGVARKFVDEEDRQLLSRFGFSLRQGMRRIFESGTDPTNTSTSSKTSLDGGLEWVTDYSTKILQDRVSWTSKLGVYQPIFYSDKSDLQDVSADSLKAVGLDTDVADFTTQIEVDFENIFTTQITKLISVNLYTRWVYDKYDNTVPPQVESDGSITPDNAAAIKGAIRKQGQFKQTLAIGLSYRFI